MKEGGADTVGAAILLKAMRDASSGDDRLRRSLRMRAFYAAKYPILMVRSVALATRLEP
jgi:hypothetical protein